MVSDQEDGIMVSFNKNGLTGMRYLWREIETVEYKQRTEKNAITLEHARKIYQSELNAESQIIAADNSLNERAASVSVAYLQIGNEVRPVYVFASDDSYTNCIFIDMCTGDVLCF